MDEKEKKYIERIVNNYQKRERTKLDELRLLDKKVKRGAKIFAYIFGVIASLVLGLGMCIAMQVIFENYMMIGIIIGIIGILLVSINYLIYKSFLNKNKKKYSNLILDLSKELLNEND